MKTNSPTVILTGLLLLACSFVASCSTDPTVQVEKAAVQQAKEIPKSLQDTVIASEDEVLTWDESADKSKPSSEKTEADQ